jgi:hypothetical protein
LIVRLWLAKEMLAFLGWFPGDRCAQLLRVVTPEATACDPRASARHVDLSLLRSGTSFPVEDFIELARWGQFTDGNRPWERMDPI